MSNEAAPHEWDVGIVWLTRHLQRPDAMLRRRYRAARPPTPTAGRPRRSRTGDALDGCLSLDELVVFVLVLVLFVVIGPGLLAITVGVIEILLVLVGAVIVLVTRLLLGQPWEIVARRGDEHHAWRVKGFRRTRDSVPALYHRPEFRWLGRVFGFTLGTAAVVELALVYLRLG